MQVSVYRLASERVDLSIDGVSETTVNGVFSNVRTGSILGHPGQSLLDVARNLPNGIKSLGQIRVNGMEADLNTIVHNGDLILVTPNVEGGLS